MNMFISTYRVMFCVTLGVFLLLTTGTSLAQKKTDVSGTYNSDFGKLVLTQTGTDVTGTYSYPGPNGTTAQGSLTGKIKGSTVTFTWEQTQAEGKAGGDGKFVFAKDGKSYKGTWKDSKGKTGTWSGKRE
jgi:hypothetical protein